MAEIENNGNGSAPVGEIISSSTDTKKTTSKKGNGSSNGNGNSNGTGTPNSIAKANLILDAGNKKLKFLINDNNPFPVDAIYKVVKGDLPVGKAGCFIHKNKAYAVGNSCHSLRGKLYEAGEGYKTSMLHIWLLGALTSDPDFLDGILKDKQSKHKYANKPCRIELNLKLLSLSTEQSSKIVEDLQNIGSFTYRGKEFELKIANLDSVDSFLFSEGFGAALTAQSQVGDADEFGILDLGGGTITFTLLRKGQHYPKVFEQYPASGGGMVSVATKIFKSMNGVDMGAADRELDSIFEALKSAKNIDSIPYRLGKKTHNIADAVEAGMDLWSSKNPAVTGVLTRVGQFLLGGGHVFAAGGGFASPVIAKWIQEYVTEDIDNPKFTVLDEPHIINLTGMRLLDKVN